MAHFQKSRGCDQRIFICAPPTSIALPMPLVDRLHKEQYLSLHSCMHCVYGNTEEQDVFHSSFRIH